MAQWKQIQLVSIRIWVPSLASVSWGSGIALGCGVGCEIGLGSGVAVSVVLNDSCSSDSTPSLEISICYGCGPKKPPPKGYKIRDLTYFKQINYDNS